MHFQKRDELFQTVTDHLDRELPLVLYRRPNETLVHGLFQHDKTLHLLNNFSQQGFVFAPFDAGKEKILLNPDDLYIGHFKMPSIKGSKKLVPTDSGKEHHLQRIQKAIGAIKEGRLGKVVISRRLTVETQQSVPTLFSELTKNYPNAFCYLFFHPTVGTWLGATPERLLHVADLHLETTSLAGTLPFVEGQLPKWTPKEMKEQQMVTDYIVGHLQSLGIHAMVKGPKNQQAGKLWHLKSEITARIDAMTQVSKIVAALHPTPAVCGLPSSEAKKFILENEHYNREFYTGFLGELNLGKEERISLYVNLRCMQLQQKRATIYVGGGITKDSDPESEWSETVNKSNTILDLL